MENTINKQHWYKSPWLIGWLLLVVIVVIVNVYMIMQSMNKFPGLVVNDFYERGQNYEENIVTKLENNQRWTTQFTLAEIHINKQTEINFSIKDSKGKPAKIEKITLFAYRPADAREDFSTPMTAVKELSDTYQAKISFSKKGKWDLLASVVIDGIEVNYAQKIFVKD